MGAASKEVKKKRGFGSKIKEIFSELKKVTWPSFHKTMRQTGVVILVVLFFLVVITAADIGLAALLNLLVSQESSSLAVPFLAL